MNFNMSNKIKNIDKLIDKLESQEKTNKTFLNSLDCNIHMPNEFNDSSDIRNILKKTSSIYDKYFKENSISDDEFLDSLSDMESELEYKINLFENCSNNLIKSINHLDKSNNIGGVSMNEGLKLIDSNGKVVNALYKNQKFSDNICNNQHLDLGKYIKGAITGDWKDAQNELNTYKGLSTSTGKVMIPSYLSADILDKARNKIVLGDVPFIPMESNNLTIAKIDRDPLFSFKEELADAEMSDMAFGQIDFKTKTAYGLMKISLELFHSAQNISQVIEEAIANAIARMIDEKGLYGSGLNEPKGILTLENINKIDIPSIENTKYQGFIKGLGAIRRSNGEPTSIAYNADIDESMNLLVDANGISLNKPKSIENLEYVISNQVKDNQAIVYDKNSIAFGIQNNISIDIDDKGLGFKDGSVYIRVYALLDVQAIYPENISLINFQK